MLLAAFVFIATAASAAATLVSPVKPSGCKCVASDPCWPSQSKWDALSANLTRPVFRVVPPGYHCHNPNYDSSLCSQAQANYKNLLWITEQPGGSVGSNWVFNSTSWCYINDVATNPCGQGRVPSVAINATTVRDVQAALQFAATYDLKTHVKGTGHDFLGRSLGPGSLLILTHYWKGTTYRPNFIYAGGQFAGVPAITVSPGTQWSEAYKTALDNGVTIIGAIGANGTVGAGGGWSMGAGHNIMSPHLNLGADNVLEVAVVLPNATHVIANAYQNLDLFWAIRGGGGPSFGVATSLTYRVYHKMPVYGAFFEATTNSSKSFVDLLNSWHATLPHLALSGWSGYYPFSSGSYLALMYLLPNGNTVLSNSTLGVWIRAAAKIPGVTIMTDASRTYDSFEAWLFANTIAPVNAIGLNYVASTSLGVGTATSSCLLPTTMFSNTTASQKLSEAMSKFGFGIGQHVGGGVVSWHTKDYNAVHPAWRDTLVHLLGISGWQDGASQSTIQAIRQNLTNAMAPVRALASNNPAQYLNEPDLLVPQFTQANWGSNYPRLLSIKKQIDPKNMLLVLQGVGSENWDAEQICPL